MYIFNLTYKKPLDVVDNYLSDHIKYLDKYYKAGNFLISGRKNPRIGGIIIADFESVEEAQKAILDDPFYQEKVAEYEITEFEATKFSDKLGL